MKCDRCRRRLDDGKYEATVVEACLTPRPPLLWTGAREVSVDQADERNVIYCAVCAQEITLAEALG